MPRTSPLSKEARARQRLRLGYTKTTYSHRHLNAVQDNIKAHATAEADRVISTLTHNLVVGDMSPNSKIKIYSQEKANLQAQILLERVALNEQRKKLKNEKLVKNEKHKSLKHEKRNSSINIPAPVTEVVNRTDSAARLADEIARAKAQLSSASSSSSSSKPLSSRALLKLIIRSNLLETTKDYIAKRFNESSQPYGPVNPDGSINEFGYLNSKLCASNLSKESIDAIFIMLDVKR